MTVICINLTRTFQTQNGSHFATWKIPIKPIMIFIENYSRIYNACFPLKVLKGKQVNKLSSPRPNPGPLKSVNKKNRLCKKFVTSPSTSSETNYKA